VGVQGPRGLKPSLPPCSPWSPPKLSNNFHPWIEKRKKKEKKRDKGPRE